MEVQQITCALLSLYVACAQRSKLFSSRIPFVVLPPHPKVIADDSAKRQREECQEGSVAAQIPRWMPVNLRPNDAQALARDLRHRPRGAPLGVARMVDRDPRHC